MIIDIYKYLKNGLFNQKNIKDIQNYEIKKYQEKERVKVYSKIQLTESQQQELDNFYEENFGEKISNIWHKYYTAFTGNFDKQYFPELLYSSLFERVMNQFIQYPKTLGDKNFLKIIASAVNVIMPKTIVSKVKGVYQDDTYNQINKNDVECLLFNAGKMFYKPTIETACGEGCGIVNFINGVEIISKLSIKDFLSNCGEDFVLQELIDCDESVSKIHPGSVNTFRIITYRWKDKFFIMPSIMRIGQGNSFLDNIHAGGIFVAIDNKGNLGDTAYTEYCEKYKEHPTTKVKFEGYKVEHFSDVLKAALRMHKAVPQMGVVNWDFTINKQGNPVLIEANCLGGSIWMSEMSHGKGCFEENTAEILHWLKIIKKLPKDKYKEYAFGNIPENDK